MDDEQVKQGERIVAYFRESFPKNPGMGWTTDRANGEAVLAYVDSLLAKDALIEQLRGTICFNREQHAKEIADGKQRREETRLAFIAEIERVKGSQSS
jgi:hypothetical protein